LLKWSILQDGKFPHHPALMAANEVASEVIGLYNTVAEAKGVQLVYQNLGDPVIYADRNSVSTIIRNLVDNALKFTHENGKVELTVENHDNDCYIQVSDSGIGIPLAELGNIFSLKNARGGQGTNGEKGNGLGLALCRELVEINHGSIEAYNQTGGGAKFVVRLPAVISKH
jgi:signal transduction histidine kinase